MKNWLLLLLMTAAPVQAQVHPQPEAGNPRMQTVDYDPAEVVQLQGAPGYQLTVELSPDEQVQNVAVGDSAAWQVSVSRSGGRLFIKPLQSDVATNMTVVTSVREYAFELVPLPGPVPEMAYTVRFRFPESVAGSGENSFVDVRRSLIRRSSYRLSGDRLLRPASVSDDGQNTYISWPRESPIPAVYVIGDSGGEAIATGMMRSDDLFVVDGVPSRLIFRIDRRVARADRIRKRGR